MADITSNLEAWWKLDETSGTSVADSSGSGFTGTSGNNTSTFTTAGKINTALNYNGSTDQITVGSGTTLGKNAAGITLAGWVKISTSAHRCMLWVSTGGSASTPRAAISWGRVTAQKITLSACVDGEAAQEITTSSAYVDNTAWHHVSGVIDFSTDTMTIYRDGVAVSTTGTPAFTGTAASNTNPLAVFIGTNTSNNRYAGGLDDVRIYSRALAAADVAALYAWRPGTIQANLAGGILENLAGGILQ